MSEATRAPVSLHFPLAPQPDIVRSSQKDEYYKRQLNENFFELVQYYLGPRSAMKVQEEVKLASHLCYYGLSTLLGRQTLGEEYCDIVQVDGNRMIPSTIVQRFFLILWQLIVPYGCGKLSIHIDRFLRPRVQTLEGKEALKEETRKKLAAWLPRLKSLLETFQRVHVAIFYFYGIYYHIPKRFMNIKYIFNRKIDEERPTYHILGVLISLQLSISFILWVKDAITSRKKKTLQGQDEPAVTSRFTEPNPETSDLSISTSNFESIPFS